MKTTPVSFNGYDINDANYIAIFNAEDSYEWSASVSMTTRPGQAPTVESVSPDARTIPLTLFKRLGSGMTDATWLSSVKGIFDPLAGRDGARDLVVTSDDGSSEWRISCYVQSVGLMGDVLNGITITLIAPDLRFESTALTTSAANPTSVTNNGNTAVAPIIALTTTNHGTRRTVTISGVGNGGGLVNYPVRVDLDTTTATSTNVYVFISGVSVPCLVAFAATATSRVWFNVDTPSDGSAVTVEVIYNTGINNPLCGLWDDGGMNVEVYLDGGLIQCTNTAWVWDHWNMATHVRRPGSWNQNGIIDNYSSVTTRIPSGPANDAMVLAIGSRSTVGSATLTGLSRETTGHTTGGGAISYVRYWTAGSTTPIIAWSTTVNGTDVSAISVDDAVRITIGCHLIVPDDTLNTGKLTISGTVRLVLDNTPTVTVGSATTVDVYSGTITIGGDIITLSSVFVADGTLTIDCDAREITSSVAGGIIGLPSITFSNVDQWALLAPGVSAVSSALTGTESMVLSFYDGFV